ncbi:hypothetical protein [Candidatus Liberibacter sp.]|uniref:hypothetical protein n=1 Tax=Candidatus Liberibacter sp. TaxID=34022 RepID=UPI001C70FC24|nr:hypothetical protein [Candidatus Liberibacter sp.]
MKNSVLREEDDYALLRKYVKKINADIVALQEMGSYDAVKKLFPEDTWEIFFAKDNNLSLHTAITVRKDTVKILSYNFHNTINNSIYMKKILVKLLRFCLKSMGKRLRFSMSI